VSDDVQYFRIEADASIDPTYPPRYLHVQRDLLGLGVEPGLVLRPVFGRNLTLSFVSMERNSVAPVHQHPQEQIGTVIEGSYEFELDGEKKVVRKGDVYVVPPNVPHGAVTHDEPCLVLDVFSPTRDAFAELTQKATKELQDKGEPIEGNVWILPSIRPDAEPGEEPV
jgi:quercetin dioxygenase-like cupin family protein